ncbi:NAD(P)/FAD-dependent oxidoreductase [Acidiferrobacter sp.]|uniref:dihydrolipoyl dehydrogenase family protein n=1 Tax=Acidiferrobacter sp. TaxID=1872107 RepID=UPI0026100A11|nr:NAD(P)/FAD-dependent oxidoreductase [Acidiferrobacter sp.]
MKCDLLVIGSGPGGYRAAVLAALRGLSAVIVEKATWGGCCLNRGCVPKKDWYHSARILNAARRFSKRGIAGALHGDLAQAWRHQRQVVAAVRDSYQSYLKRLGVTALSGQARFEDPHTVVVEPDGTRISPRAVIIATGSTPHVPDGCAVIPGRILHSDLLFDEPVPEGARVVIVGGGVVALEFAYILRAFGREVVWLARQDPFARADFSAPAMKLLRSAMSDAGLVPVRAGVRAVAATAAGVSVTTTGNEVMVADWVLLATGRRPVTAGLDPARAGLNLDAGGHIAVDDEMRAAAGVYAIGDCVAGPMTANRALYEAGVAVDNIVAPGSHKRDLARVPEALYSAIELARVGLTEDQAEDQGHEPGVGFAAFESSPRALGQDAPEGYVRLIADQESGALLGGEVLGAEAGELIHMLTASPSVGALRRIAGAAFNHPSRCEEFQNAVETLAAKWNLGQYVFGGAGDGPRGA